MPEGAESVSAPRALKVAAALGALLLAGLVYWWFQFGDPAGIRVYRAFQGAAISGDFERAQALTAEGLLGRDASGRWTVRAAPGGGAVPVADFLDGEFAGIRREGRRYLGLSGLEVVELSSPRARMAVSVRDGRIVGFEYQAKSASEEPRS